MPLSAELNQKIVALLTSLPHIHDSNAQRALVLSAGLDPQLLSQINFGASPGQFVQLLVDVLDRYGTLANGRDALEVLLETAKGYVGGKKQVECDTLINALRRFRQGKGFDQLFESKPRVLPQSSLSEEKRAALEAQLVDLYRKFKAANAQLSATLSAADKITIKNQIKQIEEEIQQIEQELEKYQD